MATVVASQLEIASVSEVRSVGVCEVDNNEFVGENRCQREKELSNEVNNDSECTVQIVDNDDETVTTEKGCDNLQRESEAEVNTQVKENGGIDNGIEDNKSLQSDIESVKRKPAVNRILSVIDSDSEEESVFPSAATKKKASLFDDESDSDCAKAGKDRTDTGASSSGDEDTDGEDKRKRKKKRKKEKKMKTLKTKSMQRIVDSDSDDDSSDDSDGKSNDEPEDSDKEKSVSNRLQNLVDSESEEEDSRVRAPFMQESTKSGQSAKKSKGEATRKGSMRASKDEAMRQIHSETQRLVRESGISLPYHRPRQRTLQEFLNRKKISAILPKAPTTAAKAKLSCEILSKALEEKEKEAQEFFKSSDSEEETPKTADSNKQENTTNINKQNDKLVKPDENVPIEETQKLTKNVQDSHNKKEIIQQGSLELGVPRKLFGGDFAEAEDKAMEWSPEEETTEQKQKSKEHKQGLREVSVPRKLFSADCNDSIDIDSRNYDTEITCGEGVKIAQEIIESLLQSVENKFRGKDAGEENEKNLSQMEITPALSDLSIPTEIIEPWSNEKETEAIEISETPCIANKEAVKILSEDNTVANDETVSAKDQDATEDKQEKEQSDDAQRENANNVESDVQLCGLPPPDISDIQDKPGSIKKKILSNIPTLEPKLRGSPGMIIDLSSDVKPNRKGINALLDRFFCKHAVNKNVSKTTEIITIGEKTDIANEDPKLNKPGAKLQRLKEDLRMKMALKRNEEWKQKELEMKEEEEELDDIEEKELDEKEPNGKELDDDVLTEDEESEPEEDDVPIREKKKPRCPFADDEAEVSDDEERDEDEETDRQECEEDAEDSDEDEKDEDEKDEENEDEDEEANCGKKKKLRRIVKAFDDDSNLTNAKDSDDEKDNENSNAIERTTTDVDMFESDNGNDTWKSENDNDMCGQENVNQMCKTPQVKSNIFSFISPITQLTALNTCTESENKDSDSKQPFLFTDGNDSISVENTPNEKASQSSCDKRVTFQKKLFEDTAETVTEEELMQLCSGKFPSTQTTDSDMAKLLTSQPSVSTSQLFDMCSGTFSTQSINEKSINDTVFNSQTSQDTVLKQDSVKDTNEAKESTKSNTKPWTKFRIVSSDEEDEADTESKKKQVKKRKMKQLKLSDDENDENDSADEEEDEEEEGNLSNEEETFVDYDSDENEVVVVPKKDIKKVAAKYLDEEAELSESDWDSADEDEKGLDNLELEEADNEEIDEDQVRSQVGRLHMRQVLDEDQREVRMLKELLFEDGDLHSDGSGRERKFKWRNIDKLGDTNEASPITDDGDGWVDLHEDENEAEWRKLRHEREKFLEERMKSTDDDIENDLAGSQIFKLGIKALKKMQNTSSQKEDEATSAIPTNEPIMPRTLTDLLDGSTLGGKSRAIHNAMKKHSLLARGEQSLARIAMLAKQNEPSVLSVNQRNFVFAHVSPLPKNEEEADEEADKNEELNLSDKRRKRKATASSTPMSAKRAKVENPFARRKKLF